MVIDVFKRLNPKHPQTYFKKFSILKEALEQNPHNQFVTLLNALAKSENVLDGTVSYFYKHRNSLWFKMFFRDENLHALVVRELEYQSKHYPNIRLTLTPRGIMIFDNYKPNSFNILLLTIHDGTWVEDYVQSKMLWSPEKRYLEEDVETNKIYSQLVFKYGGIWIENKQSRFMCDFNRSPEKAIYDDRSEKWINNLWAEPLTNNTQRRIMKSYDQFYLMLSKIVEVYNFNIIFDAHSMRNKKSRPDISFGIAHSPAFYIPIVLQMQDHLRKELSKSVEINKPYKGGYILKWLEERYPNRFIFSMEINKRLYMNRRHDKPSTKKIINISNALANLFDFDHMLPKHILYRGNKQEE
jgi:N-formylglutamate amidohydrolase